ncbi:MULTISPECIES: DUF1257 domain-containing protein [Nostoc]|uniref:DUF1257 domain-containing protein n=1 Tax=Nostoc paludosum FACHB-159 TaxID=2692908 RepID=A0ABR8KGW5_9NOSO|nr:MULTISPECIES: DUF1257 domain-containing protein [Nostoc]MBD2682391.1 DUF1257 domain-containing protein [Nostoc sp. FACHB-857]MBD2738784.1 DUF1257 domain-containing protein [Nostoc paludosum FACHB-159]
MSHFSTVRTRLVSLECLVQALEDLKLQPKVYSSPQPLTGYYGNDEGQSAEIVVAGYTIKARADIGFRWSKADEAYQVIHDEYETAVRLGENFFSHQLMQAYAKRMVMAKAQELQERFGECNITESGTGQVQTLRLTFAGHQEISQYARR